MIFSMLIGYAAGSLKGALCATSISSPSEAAAVKATPT